jgi:hypothetical protein
MRVNLIAGVVALGLSVQALAFDWSEKSIQVEREYPDGKWGPDDPIPLDRNSSVIGNGVGAPDISMTLDPIVSEGKVRLNRRLEVSCGARKVFDSGFVESVIAMPWSVEMHSPCGTWKFTLVDSSKALHIPRAAPGEFPPASPSHD